MKPTEPTADQRNVQSSELLIMPDGRILAHNITPAMAVILRRLNPGDEAMKLREQSATETPGAEADQQL